MKYFYNFLVIILFLSTTSFAQTLDPSYFANQEVQSLSPNAFALQPEAKNFLQNIKDSSIHERDLFLKNIKNDRVLFENIQNFALLAWPKKEEVLRSVFALEVLSLNITAPNLIIDSKRIKGEAFFDFDVTHPDAGTVIINPEAIQKDPNPYTSLMLLIHETRHSAQFQLAFNPAKTNDAVAIGFKAAFIAQKDLSANIKSFSDFLTLLNEYEAFSFGNYVVGELTNGKVNTLGMGTFASQYNADKSLKINLDELFLKFDHGEIKDSVLEEFNRQEKAQYDLLKAK